MTFETVITGLISAIGYLNNLSKEMSVDKKKIEHSLEIAIERTFFHIEETRTIEKNDKASMELYEKWMDVALLIGKYDPVGEKNFKSKAKYWKMPSAWIDEINSIPLENRLKTSLEHAKSELQRLKEI